MAWPPERIDTLVCIAGAVTARFRDPWTPYDRLGTPSLWDAVFEPRARAWRLTRIQYLDYEGEDLP